MAINDKSKKSNKSVAFKANIEEDEDRVEGNIDDKLTESISLIDKRIGKVNNVRKNVKDILSPNFKGFNP